MEANGRHYANVPGKIPGTLVNLGGQEYVLAPLNLVQCEQFELQIAELGNASAMDFKQQFAIALPLIHASLSRNYPNITLDEVRNILDLGNFKAAALAVVESSGFVPASPGE